MKKRTLIAAIVASTLSVSAFADPVFLTQNASYTGSAGNTSSNVGIDPFVFDMFDNTLGTLLGINVSYYFAINNGIVGADNLSNEIVTGTGTLGGNLTLSSSLSFITNSFQSAFTPLSLSTTDNLYLAADPTLSAGGNGLDVDSFAGQSLFDSVSDVAINSLVWDQFTTIGSDQFDVNFNTGSIVIVNAPGSRGFFQAVDTEINMTLTYAYEAAQQNTTSDVSVPIGVVAFGALGLLLAGRRKF